VAVTTGFPSSFPYVLALDYGAATEELVTVTAAGGTTLTVTRGFSGTSAQSHSTGAVVRHVVNAQDLTDFRTHEAATASVHGVTGALVGATQSQTLTNKTLTSPTINGAALSGTFTGAPTLSGAVVLSGTPSISNGAALAGTFSGTPTLSGAALFTGAPYFQGAAAANTVLNARVSGDAQPRLTMGADGKLSLGSGSAVADTVLYRSAADTLTTDDSFTVGGGLTVGSTTWTTYIPTVGGGGSVTWTTRTGYYYKIGKLVFLTIYLQVNGSGTGASTLTITAPSSIDRSLRQVLAVNIESSATINGAATLMAFLGGSGAIFDRIRVYDGGSMGGSDLSAGTLVTIQGWYREA
jgi:hypothetical protein